MIKPVAAQFGAQLSATRFSARQAFWGAICILFAIHESYGAVPLTNDRPPRPPFFIFPKKLVALYTEFNLKFR